MEVGTRPTGMGVIVLQRIREVWKVPTQEWVRLAEPADETTATTTKASAYRPAAPDQPPSPCADGCACPDRKWCAGSQPASVPPEVTARPGLSLVKAYVRPNDEGSVAGDPTEIDSAGPRSSDAGMSTVEYAVGTVVAAAFAAVLYKIVTGDSVVAGLTNLINTALNTTF
jgi:hypothetical protein